MRSGEITVGASPYGTRRRKGIEFTELRACCAVAVFRPLAKIGGFRMLATQSDAISREELTRQMSAARQQTDDLFRIVKPEFVYDRPIAERHRIVFYIGHLEAFDWNLFHERIPGLKSFHPEFDRLFAFGIDPVGGGLPTDQTSEWPSIVEVEQYVRKIRELLDEKLGEAIADSRPPAPDESQLSTLLNVAIEHRLMHAETLAYMLHQ